MDLHESLTFGNTNRTQQGAEGPPRELPTLPLFTMRPAIIVPENRKQNTLSLCGVETHTRLWPLSLC